MKGIIITHIIFVETPNTETTLETQTYMEWRLKQIVTRCRVNRREYNIKTNVKEIKYVLGYGMDSSGYVHIQVYVGASGTLS